MLCGYDFFNCDLYLFFSVTANRDTLYPSQLFSTTTDRPQIHVATQNQLIIFESIESKPLVVLYLNQYPITTISTTLK